MVRHFRQLSFLTQHPLNLQCKETMLPSQRLSYVDLNRSATSIRKRNFFCFRGAKRTGLSGTKYWCCASRKCQIFLWYVLLATLIGRYLWPQNQNSPVWPVSGESISMGSGALFCAGKSSSRLSSTSASSSSLLLSSWSCPFSISC